jgi:hypothetical protein
MAKDFKVKLPYAKRGFMTWLAVSPYTPDICKQVLYAYMKYSVAGRGNFYVSNLCIPDEVVPYSCVSPLEAQGLLNVHVDELRYAKACGHGYYERMVERIRLHIEQDGFKIPRDFGMHLPDRIAEVIDDLDEILPVVGSSPLPTDMWCNSYIECLTSDLAGPILKKHILFQRSPRGRYHQSKESFAEEIRKVRAQVLAELFPDDIPQQIKYVTCAAELLPPVAQ